MQGTLDLFEQIGNAVGVETRAAAAETSGSDAKGRALRGSFRHQPPAQGVVDHVTKGAARPAALGLQLRRHVIVQRQGGAHIMMLDVVHHDVNVSA